MRRTETICRILAMFICAMIVITICDGINVRADNSKITDYLMSVIKEMDEDDPIEGVFIEFQDEDDLSVKADNGLTLRELEYKLLEFDTNAEYNDVKSVIKQKRKTLFEY